MRRRRNRQLTVREKEVLYLVAAGYEDSEIGVALIIGERTVSNHVSHILLKLNAHNRTQAVTLALLAGKITQADIPPIINET